MDNKKGTPMERRTQLIKEHYTPDLGELSSDSQKRDILKYMMEHRSITQAEAIEHIGCYRLSARISELRDMDINIVTFMEDNTHNSGRHARYFLEERSE